MKAAWHGRVVAESERTVEVGGYWYFPRDSVRTELLRTAPKTSRDRECPHGVQFYDLVDDAELSERAAWSYEAPTGSMQRIGGWVGFWEDVEVA